MSKFHYNPATGATGSCEAKPGNCPFLSDEEHFPSESAAREAFEKSMEKQLVTSFSKDDAWAHHGNLEPDTFLSVMTTQGDVLTERFAPDLAKDLEPGSYSVAYVENGKDYYGIATVEEDGSFSLKRTRGFKKVETESSQKTRDSVKNLRENMKNYIQTASKGSGADPVTAGEIYKQISRTLVKHDWNSTIGATRGRLELEDVEWALENDLTVAMRQNASGEIKALKDAKKTISDFLNQVSPRN